MYFFVCVQSLKPELEGTYVVPSYGLREVASNTKVGVSYDMYIRVVSVCFLRI